MKKIFVALCILSLVGMVAWKLTEGIRTAKKEDDLLLQTSDLKSFSKVITVWGDDWLGYMVFRSRHFQRLLEEQDIGYQFAMEFDFKKRFDGLANGDCDMVVATVDSFLVNGAESRYPGVITFVIDESYGGDAIIGLPGLKTIDDLKQPGIRGAFVGYSPSEFLLKSQIVHFQLDALRPRLNDFRVDNAETALEKLTSGQADFAVLWEPLTSAALREVKGSTRLIDTSSARGIIVDVAIASRQLVANDPAVVEAVTTAYFKTLHHYLGDADALKALARGDSAKSAKEANEMLAGIQFSSINDNVALYGLGGSAGVRHITDRITDVAKILVDVGDLPRDPFNGNPRAITNSRFLEPARAAVGGAAPQTREKSVFTAKSYYRPLSPSEWESLTTNLTGTLIDEPITFGSGDATIPDEFKEELTKAIDKLTHYPKHRIIVQAHVSQGNDPAADTLLSQERADAIRDHLVAGGVPADRILAAGKGSSELLEQGDGESLRAWKRRCRRAKIFIAPEQ